MTFEQMQKRDEVQFPYIVENTEFDFGEYGDSIPRQFATWAEALAAQEHWNTTCKGHKARRRKAGERAKNPAQETLPQ